jgi:integrase
MPRYQMTWIPASRRWRKVKGGKVYVVSCRQLGTLETKEASWRAANEWWERQESLANIPAEDDRLARAARISNLVRDFSKLDDAARRDAVEALLGSGSYDSLKSQASTMLAGMTAPAPGRTVAAQVEAWQSLLRGVCQSGQMSEGRFDAYCRKIRPFADFIGGQMAVDAIDESKLEGFYSYLTGKVAAGDYSPSTAHEIMMTAKQFVRWLAERKAIPLPGNIDSRRFRFNHTSAAKVEVFTADEVREILGRASERMRLYLLLMVQAGMYQNDVAELRQDEVDWQAGTITRARSKTRERNGPVVTYKLWPETFALLKRHRNPGSEIALTTERGNPLVSYTLKDGKLKRYDAIQSAWSRMGKARLGMKHLRKTSATLLSGHPQFKYYAAYYLADSPKGMDQRHYVKPNDAEFFEALEWLRSQIFR